MNELEFEAADFQDWYIWEIVCTVSNEFQKRAALFHWAKTGSSYKYDSINNWSY